jgi:IS30 family transposase
MARVNPTAIDGTPLQGRQRKLSIEQVDQLVEWREAGWSYLRIALQLGVSEGAVHYQCLRNGAVSPRQRLQAVPTQPHAFVAGDGRTQRLFTQAEDERLVALDSQGMSYSAIAREMGRAYTSVRMRLLTIAMREDIPA